MKYSEKRAREARAFAERIVEGCRGDKDALVIMEGVLAALVEKRTRS